jgi:4-amino-4-deoxy-L-arabinose transferase-like glycosyltransferase
MGHPRGAAATRRTNILKGDIMSSLNVQDVKGDFPASIDPDSAEGQPRDWFASAGRRRVYFWMIVVLLGFVQAWSHRQLVDHDGVAYIDVAENYARGAWSSAINAYYSPLYSWLLAIGLRLLQVPRSGEATLLHLINFAGYLGAYACFEFFLREVIREGQAKLRSEDQATSLSETAWHTLGLGLFLYSTMCMANLSGRSGQGDPGSTPDIFVVLFVFLAAGLLKRMQSGQAQAGTYSLLGVVLGFAYFAKTVMFPLSLLFIAVAGFISIRRKRVRLFLLAPVCFALIVGPWVAILSHAQEHFTFGDAGRLTYRWLVGPHANPVEWGGQTDATENLVHPPHLLRKQPPVYEFATPVAGTFPLWYGSSYWLSGWKFHFSLAGQMRIFRQSYNTYWELLRDQKEFLVLLLALVLVQGKLRDYFKTLLAGWVLWLPALAGLGLYALVRVEPRYVAPFTATLWISLFMAARLPRKEEFQTFAQCAVAAAVLTTCAYIVRSEISDFHSIVRRDPSEQVKVAAGLREMGILEGQALATIGIPRDSYYWARLAHVRVIAEIPTPNVNQYWFAPSDTQEEIRSLFAQTGAVAIVTDTVPAAVTYPESSLSLSVPGWQRIGDTSYFLFPLQTQPALNARGKSQGLPDR